MMHATRDVPLEYTFCETKEGGYCAKASLTIEGVIFSFSVEITRAAVEKIHARYHARMRAKGAPAAELGGYGWNPLKKIKRLVSKKVLKQALQTAYKNAVLPAVPSIARDFASRTGKKLLPSAVKKAYGLAVGAMTGNPESLRMIAGLAKQAYFRNPQALAALWVYNQVAQHAPRIRKVESLASSALSRAPGVAALVNLPSGRRAARLAARSSAKVPSWPIAAEVLSRQRSRTIPLSLLTRARWPS